MLSEELLSILQPCCESQGAYLIDVVLRGKHARPVVEVLIDAEAGVTTELCSAVSRKVESVLDAEDRIAKSYTLIVSSPGIERPLKFLWQFKKHVGRSVTITTEEALPAARPVSGKLLAVSDESIAIEIDKNQVQMPFTSIREAIVNAPW